MSLGILEYSDSAKAGGIVLRSASGTAPRVTLQSEPNDAHPPPPPESSHNPSPSQSLMPGGVFKSQVWATGQGRLERIDLVI